MNIIVKNIRAIAIILLPFSFTLKPMNPTGPELPAKNFLVDRSKYPHLEGEAIYRKHIFEWLTGMPEEKFVNYYNTNGKLPELPSKTQQLIDGMKPETYTLSTLKSAAQDKLTHSNGTLSVLYLDVMKHPEKRHLIDIGALQAKHSEAVFQTASRPSGLEGRQMIYQANKEKIGSEPAFDYRYNGFTDIIGASAVQGEEGAISCAVKAIYQMYMIDKNINLFANIGIETNPRGRIQTINSNFLKTSSLDSLSDNICVRLWHNVPVTTGPSNVLFQSETIAKGAQENKPFNSSLRKNNRDDANMIVTEPCFISQVNVSAIDLSKDKNTKEIKGFGEDHALANQTAYAALKAAYEATIYAAIKESKTKVFLTLVGCGAFQNKLEWIADILDNMTETIKKSGLDITLVAMDANGHLSEKQKNAWEKIKNITTKTNGRITDASQIEKPITANLSPAGMSTPTESEMKPSFFTIIPSNLGKKFLLGVGGGLSFIGLLFALKYYCQNTTAKK